ncbi:MAG: DUF2231 domain-containing protein [Fimbriimonas sp.]
MRLLRVFLCVGACLAAAFSQAKPEFWDLFQKHYKPEPQSAIKRAECVTCHTAKGKFSRNSYGKQIEKLVKGSAMQTLTALMLDQAGKLDANANGVTNEEEIRKGDLPASEAPSAAKAEPVPDLIPRHSFHPAFVHFPIALFLFGAVVDFWGFRKRRPEFRVGAALALWFGSLSSLLALPTGVAAWLRLGFPLEGNTLIHLILAVSASALMIGVASWRRRAELDGVRYWTTLAVATALIAAAGHFGSLMVYG